MSYPYLDQLHVNSDERARLAGLAAPTPAALLSLIQAAPEDFQNFYGTEATQCLIYELEQMLDQQQLSLLRQPVRTRLATGAVISLQVPALREPGYNLTERDRLFSELQAFRREANQTDSVCQRIQQLEIELNTMLEATG